MAASTHQTKRSLLAAIAIAGGEARLVEIARAMGPEWTTGRKYARLRQLVRQMEESNDLVRTRRGVYAVHPTFDRRGFDARDLTVRQIEEYLTECCGVAETWQIHDAVGTRDIGDGARDAEHNRITSALAETPEKFCQPYGPGVWALTAEVRARLPLPGRLADRDMDPSERDLFFERVGSAFAEARGEREVGDVIAMHDIREALAVMANAAADAKAEFLAALANEVREELRAKGVRDEYAVTLAAYDREEVALPMDLYLAFEAGDSRLHLVAPPEFYRATAALFGVDAARLSRGEVAHLLSGEGGNVDNASCGLSS